MCERVPCLAIDRLCSSVAFALKAFVLGSFGPKLAFLEAHVRTFQVVQHELSSDGLWRGGLACTSLQGADVKTFVGEPTG